MKVELTQAQVSTLLDITQEAIESASDLISEIRREEPEEVAGQEAYIGELAEIKDALSRGDEEKPSPMGVPQCSTG